MRAQTERALKLARPVFKRTLGVTPSTFHSLLEVLHRRERAKPKKGRAPKLELEDQLVLTLSFWRQ